MANAAAGAELNKKKKARQPRLPNVLEQQLLTMYPCIERMPTEIKELFLDICFVRPESVLTERTIKARGEICTKLEFSLLPMVKNIKFALHAVVEQLREDVHFEPQCYW